MKKELERKKKGGGREKRQQCKKCFTIPGEKLKRFREVDLENGGETSVLKSITGDDLGWDLGFGDAETAPLESASEGKAGEALELGLW